MPDGSSPGRRPLAGAVLAAALLAVAVLGPEALRPAFAAVAGVLAAAIAGRAGAFVAALADLLLLPLPGPERLGLATAALAAGEAVEHGRRRAHVLLARSFTDRLTGLRNYDFFAEALRAEVARARRYGGCVTLVLLDLDRFKAVNDQHGHRAGNLLLAGVGRALAAAKREADVAARFGGEEFAVLVPGRSTDGIAVAERMRAAISEVALPRRGPRAAGPLRATASAGVATFPVDAADADELLEQADRALYEAKRAGRDRAVAASADERPLARAAGA